MLRIVALVALVTVGQGCSVQLLGPSGAPRLIGVGRVAAIGETGQDVYRVTAPGVGFRAYSGFAGMSVGWSETVLFLPSAEAADRPLAALQLTVYGLDAGQRQLSLGYDRTFVVVEPDGPHDFVQEIHYAERDPTSARVTRKEFP